MFLAKEKAHRLLELQTSAYNLFLWIKESMTWGRLEFTDKHTGKDPNEIMRRWITNNRGSFPRFV